MILVVCRFRLARTRLPVSRMCLRTALMSTRRHSAGVLEVLGCGGLAAASLTTRLFFASLLFRSGSQRGKVSPFGEPLLAIVVVRPEPSSLPVLLRPFLVVLCISVVTPWLTLAKPRPYSQGSVSPSEGRGDFSQTATCGLSSRKSRNSTALCAVHPQHDALTTVWRSQSDRMCLRLQAERST